jgi:hypothetical protein
MIFWSSFDLSVHGREGSMLKLNLMDAVFDGMVSLLRENAK